MENKNEYSEILEAMSSKGLTIDGLLDCKISCDRSMFSMSSDSEKKFNEYLYNLDKPQKCTKDKGDVLENLACCLMFSDTPLFNIKRNVHTSSNEIDLLVNLTDKGKYIIPKYYNYLGDQFLCECKNYKRNLNVTYVGKFYSLIKSTNSKIGILFTVKGVTGTNDWKDSKAFIRKVALKENIAILVFSKSDYILLKDNKKSFLDIVDDKYHSLMNDISYIEYISKHEAEDKFTEHE